MTEFPKELVELEVLRQKDNKRCVMVHTFGTGTMLAFGFAPSDASGCLWIFQKFGGTGNRVLIEAKNIISCVHMRLEEASK